MSRYIASEMADERDVSETIDQVRQIALPLGDAGDLDPLLERIGDARFVLLGEASHGTAEYYTWRRIISERLILENGFSFIAVEGDWPDCYRINRYIKGRIDSASSAADVLRGFHRWPTWMWANDEVAGLVDWLQRHNLGRPEREQVGFYGLDVYSLWDSMRAVLNYLKEVDGKALAAAKRAFECFDPYEEDAQQYARATSRSWFPADCEDEVVAMLARMQTIAPDHPQDGREAHFNAEQNSIVAKNAENYYRTMARGGSQSWNVRDHHMVETLDRLTEFYGSGAKAIVWEHNTHIGDARATDMARAGMINVGQLVRERHASEGVALVGFGSYKGSVIAGQEWEAPMEKMTVPPARRGSWEDLLHRVDDRDKMLLLEPHQGPASFSRPRGHRAIGVVYDPAHERYGNYVPTILPQRYDAFLYLDETQALHPLAVDFDLHEEAPQTYPSAV